MRVKKAFGDRFKVYEDRTLPWAAYHGNTPISEFKSLTAGFAEDMDYLVQKRPMYYQDSNGQFRLIERSVALVRDATFDDDEHYIGTVSKNYNPLQNAQFAQLFDAFSDSEFTKLVAWGSFRQGGDTFAAFQIKNGVFMVGSEVNDRYLMVYNRHAGNMALKIAIVTLRRLCLNALMMQLEAAENKVRLFHNNELIPKAEFVVSTMNEASAFGDTLIHSYKQMMDYELKTHEQALGLFWQIAEVPHDVNIANQDKYKAALAMYEDFTRIYDSEAVNDGTHGTLYGVFNTVTAYANHMRGRKVAEQLLQPYSSRTQLMRRAYKLCTALLGH